MRDPMVVMPVVMVVMMMAVVTGRG